MMTWVYSCRLRPAELALQQLRRAADAAERVLDLVGEVADQFAVGLLLLEQPLLARDLELLVDLAELEQQRAPPDTSIGDHRAVEVQGLDLPARGEFEFLPGVAPFRSPAHCRAPPSAPATSPNRCASGRRRAGARLIANRFSAAGLRVDGSRARRRAGSPRTRAGRARRTMRFGWSVDGWAHRSTLHARTTLASNISPSRLLAGCRFPCLSASMLRSCSGDRLAQSCDAPRGTWRSPAPRATARLPSDVRVLLASSRCFCSFGEFVLEDLAAIIVARLLRRR